MSLTEAENAQLDQRGYFSLENFVSEAMLDDLRCQVDRLFAEEGEDAGSEFKQEAGCRRLANLVNKGDIFREIITLPRLLESIECVLGADFKLSSLNARSANPHSATSQPLHADMGAVADERGSWVCNSVWLLDDFTETNGAIRMIPGSHRWGQLPDEALSDPLAPHPDEVLLTGRAGTAVIMNAHMWHGATPNRTDRPRTALHAFFARRDKPQQQYQKMLLSREVEESLSPKLRWLLALDDPQNDRISAQVQKRSGFLK